MFVELILRVRRFRSASLPPSWFQGFGVWGGRFRIGILEDVVVKAAVDLLLWVCIMSTA